MRTPHEIFQNMVMKINELRACLNPPGSNERDQEIFLRVISEELALLELKIERLSKQENV
jgi:hypothetical protein